MEKRLGNIINDIKPIIKGCGICATATIAYSLRHINGLEVVDFNGEEITFSYGDFLIKVVDVRRGWVIDHNVRLLMDKDDNTRFSNINIRNYLR